MTVVAAAPSLGPMNVAKDLLSLEEKRRLGAKSNVVGLLLVLHAWGLILGSMAFFAWWPNPFTFLLGVMVVGGRQLGLAILMHDAAHWRAYANRTVNDIVGEIIALPTSTSMAGYRNSHFAHHRELNSDNDPDWTRNIGLPEFEFPKPRPTVIGYILQYLSGLKIYSAVSGFHKNAETRDIPALINRARLIFFVALLIAAIAFGFWKQLLLYWVVPLLTVFLAIRYIRNVAEHYAVEHEHVLNESRTVLANPVELWLIAPWGLNYHLEHHLFPGIPCFRLAELHKILMTREPFPQIAHITHGYFTGLLRDCATAPRPDLKELLTG